jgi:hypothetical protein
MSDYTNLTVRADAVATIGKGERLTETIVPLIVASLPENFDAAARGAVSKAVVAWADPEGRKRQKTGKAGEQVTTDFGRGVDTLTRAVKAALKGEAPETDWLRLVRQAAENAANKGHATEDAIMSAVREALAAVAGEEA